MSFFTGFSFYLPIFDKDQPISDKNHPEVAIGWFIGETGRFIGVPSFHCSFVVSGAFQPNFTDFCRILPKFSKTVGIGDVRFS
jgi:hypothetical protein